MNSRKFLILFLLFPFLTVAQVTRITGSAPGAEGKIIRIMAPRDLITMEETTLAEGRVDSAGKFNMTANLKTVQFGSLNIDFHRAEVYFEPGKLYFFKCAPMNYNATEEVNPLIQSESIQIDGMGSDKDDVNFYINQFNILYNNFLLKNFNALYHDRNRSKIDDFHDEVVTTFMETKNFYFGIYIRYKIAGLEQLAQSGGKPALAKRYFMDSPIIYENTEYMDFFNQFFTKYLTAGPSVFKLVDYQKIINGPDNYLALMRTLGKDTVLKKPQLRELVLLKGLMEMLQMEGYNKDNILALLDKISKESKFEEHKIIAEDIIINFNKLRKGTPAPAFTLMDRDRKMVSLKDLAGKPVLLNFWTTYCQGCLSEMDKLRPVSEKYKDKLNIVSISVDNNYDKMLFFITMKKDFTWTFLHIGDQLQLLKDYEVSTYPLYVLIDGHGKIFKYPADMPGEGLEAELDALVNP